MAVLAIVVGMATATKAQMKSVSFAPLANDIFLLTYLNQGECKLKAEVINHNGKVLCVEQFNENKSFKKQFSFQDLGEGDFSLRVTDSEGVYTTKIKKTEDGSITASINVIDGGDAKVVVKGMYTDPIYLNVYAGSEVLASNEYIDQRSGFSKEYTFEDVNTDDIVIEVVAVKKVLASVKF